MRREEIIRKMFEAALREKFQRLRRTHDAQAVIRTWTQFVKEDKSAEYFQKAPWRSETTIGEALDFLENFFHPVTERMKNSG